MNSFFILKLCIQTSFYASNRDLKSWLAYIVCVMNRGLHKQ
jgi:hypothetical protein